MDVQRRLVDVPTRMERAQRKSNAAELIFVEQVDLFAFAWICFRISSQTRLSNRPDLNQLVRQCRF